MENQPSSSKMCASRAVNVSHVPDKVDLVKLRGSTVKITLLTGDKFVGMIIEPTERVKPDEPSVFLIKCCGDPTNKRRADYKLQKFFMREILEVKMLYPPPVRNTSKNAPNPDIQLVVDEADYRAKMKKLNREKMVGFNMYGHGYGQNREIGWVCFYAKGVVMAFDVPTLVSKMGSHSLWKLLKNFLESFSVKKIVYDSRNIMDYLWNRQDIVLRNHEDLSALDWTIRESFNKTSNQYVARPLFTILNEYLSTELPLEEQELLSTCNIEGEEFLKRPPWRMHANCKKIMVVHLKYLLELQREMNIYKGTVDSFKEIVKQLGLAPSTPGTGEVPGKTN